MSDAPVILFTAFEPSGDDHASGVIAAIKQMAPQVRIMAYGGPKMQAAGAELIETTTEHAVMLAGAIGQAWAHKQRVGRVRQWLKNNRIAVHVPVDSPAANWAICQAVRDLAPQARITHLVAPQLWAWAPGRIKKLRRLTDHVLCLLPFEQEWFTSRGVKTTFVGHPLFDKPRRTGEGQLLGLPSQASPKLALLPGSRRGEILKNWPTMLKVVAELRQKHPGLLAVGALRDDAAIQMLPDKGMTLPPGVLLKTGRTEAVLDWADAVLVVSGTATLLVAAYRKPMVTMFNANPVLWHGIGRWLINTRTFTLPNLISESLGIGRAVPEFVPHFGQVEPIVDALEPLLANAAARQKQERMIDQLIAPFHGHACGKEAAAAILREARIG
jgi:lipid-A-disaccharide synthase